MRELNYLVKIEENELLLERFIEAINNETCKVDKVYPNPYCLDSGEKFLLDSILRYFFKTRNFSKELYISFIEKLRKLSGFRSYDYILGSQAEKQVYNRFKNARNILKNNASKFQPDENLPKRILRQDEEDALSFMCYVAICNIKYGPNHASITANEYFDLVSKLGSEEVKKLKKVGTGKLQKELIEYKDNNTVCNANDVFATIKIKIINESEESYRQALIFINNLLKTDFPKSFEIVFSSAIKELLPIKGLPKCGQNYFFAGAVKYSNLHERILEYIILAKKQYEWYNNLEEEDCAIPSTFAVFALGLQNNSYFDILIDYFQTLDAEHQSIQENFTLAFLKKYGIDEKSIIVYINVIKSMQEHPHDKIFSSYFTTENSLNLLLESKTNFVDYFFTEEDLKDFSNGKTLQEMADYLWESVMYTTFGLSKNYDQILKRLNVKEKEIFNKLITSV